MNHQKCRVCRQRQTANLKGVCSRCLVNHGLHPVKVPKDVAERAARRVNLDWRSMKEVG